MVELDKLDKDILNILQMDAKITNVALAEKIKLSPASTLERVRKLEQHQLVTNYYAKIDLSKIGFPIHVMVGLELERMTAENIKLFQTTIDKMHAITTCYQVIGCFDFILMTHAKNMALFQTTVVEKLYALPIVHTIQTLHITQLFKHKPLVLE